MTDRDQEDSHLELFRRLAGWRLRRHKSLAPLRTQLGIDIDALPEELDWNTYPLASYLSSPPHMYYYEPAFTEYFGFLEDTYGSDLSLFIDDLAASPEDVWTAVEEAERIANDIYGTDLDSFDSYKTVDAYLHSWYLRLVEQAFDALLYIPAYRLQANRGKRVSPQPFNIYEVIQSHQWINAGAFYNPVVRRGIAHNISFKDPGLYDPVEVVYTDNQGNSTSLTVEELTGLVNGLSDECLAYSFALRLFLFEHRNAGELQRIIDPGTHPFPGRSLAFIRAAGSPYFSVQSVHGDTVNNETQIRLECEDKTLFEAERYGELMSVLASAGTWFPEGDTFWIGAEGRKRPKSGLRISGADLRAWLDGNLTNQELGNRLDPYVMFPFRVPLGRVRATARRAIAAGLSSSREDFRRLIDYAHGLPEGIRFISLEDISTGFIKRYRCEIEIHATDQSKVREVLPPLMPYIVRRVVHRNEQARKRWGRAAPQYVIGFIYSREKRPRDRFVDNSAQYYVGRFEWRAEKANAENIPEALDPSTSEILAPGLSYEANNTWPPPDRFIPRPFDY